MRPRAHDKKKVVDDFEPPAMMGQRKLSKGGRVLISDNHVENKKNRSKLRAQKLADFRKQEIALFEELEDELMRDVEGGARGRKKKSQKENDDGDIEVTMAQVFGVDPVPFSVKRERNKSNRVFTQGQGRIDHLNANKKRGKNGKYKKGAEDQKDKKGDDSSSWESASSSSSGSWDSIDEEIDCALPHTDGYFE